MPCILLQVWGPAKQWRLWHMVPMTKSCQVTWHIWLFGTPIFAPVVRVFLFYLSSTEIAGDGEFLELLNMSHERSSWLVDMCTYISILWILKTDCVRKGLYYLVVHHRDLAIVMALWHSRSTSTCSVLGSFCFLRLMWLIHHLIIMPYNPVVSFKGLLWESLHAFMGFRLRTCLKPCDGTWDPERFFCALRMFAGFSRYKLIDVVRLNWLLL